MRNKPFYFSSIKASLTIIFLIQVYMINLKRRPDRYDKMVRCFEELGIDFKYVEAVDGK